MLPHFAEPRVQVEANCQDVRLRRLLEAAALMLQAVKDHLHALQQAVPADVRPVPGGGVHACALIPWTCAWMASWSKHCICSAYYACHAQQMELW